MDILSPGSIRSRMRSYLAFTAPSTVFTLGLLLLSPVLSNAQCPAYGADSTCGTVITITNTGATVTATGQGPYDGIDDTLVGVVNNSNIAIKTLGLSSGLDIFGFDGDGIDTYGAPGNAQDNTGYGGPNSYFTNINGGQTAGTVNFVAPLAINGGSTYFSLENALSAATACTTILNNSLTGPTASGTSITASFTPNLGYTLAQAEAICGFTNFDWQQTITSWPSPSPLFQVGNSVALTAPPPFFDPPPGGYTYELTHGYPNGDHSYPFYYDPNSGELQGHESGNTLSFGDAPSDPCLPGGSGSGCGGHTALAGSQLAFTTHLAGVNPDGTATDLGIGFTWTSTFNGTSGGTATTKNSLPTDPGSGTGGITITSVNEITTYQPVNVTSINGVPPGSTPTLGSGRECNGVFGGTFNGNITVNAGQSCSFINGTITGNVQVNGGSLTLAGDLIEGNVAVEGGTVSVGPFTTINSDLVIQNLPATSTTNQVCNATIVGNLVVQGNAGTVQLGAAPPSPCAGNVVGANLLIQANSGTTTTYGNTVTGSTVNQ